MSGELDRHAEDLAAAIHGSWMEKLPPGERGGAFAVAWDELTAGQKQPALASAMRIPAALNRVGLRLETGVANADAERVVIQYLEGRMEALASREHEAWAAQKIQTGWTYGPARDEARKFHPMLVPYDALPESEKEKDRAVIRNYPKYARMAGLKIVRDT